MPTKGNNRAYIRRKKENKITEADICYCGGSSIGRPNGIICESCGKPKYPDVRVVELVNKISTITAKCSENTDRTLAFLDKKIKEAGELSEKLIKMREDIIKNRKLKI